MTKESKIHITCWQALGQFENQQRCVGRQSIQSGVVVQQELSLEFNRSVCYLFSGNGIHVPCFLVTLSRSTSPRTWRIASTIV